MQGWFVSRCCVAGVANHNISQATLLSQSASHHWHGVSSNITVHSMLKKNNQKLALLYLSVYEG